MQKHSLFRVWKQWKQQSDTWPFVVRLKINSKGKFHCVSRWLYRDVRVAICHVGWWFDKRDHKDCVQEPPKSFFFQNRLVAATPGRRNWRKMPKIQIENGEFAKLLGEHYPNQRSSFRDLINKFEILFEIILLQD